MKKNQWWSFLIIWLALHAPSSMADMSPPEMDSMGHMKSMDTMNVLNPSDCPAMTVWDIDNAMCMPYAMAGMKMSQLMFHGNGFAVLDSQGGPRGRTALAGPDMFMIDAGKSFGGNQFFNVEFMGTAELWTYPSTGYPELLQIGELQTNGQPFVDAQHPHSSPIMGLTFSDRISLNNNNDDTENLKIFFAPRGQSTDGPIPFMHRLTGMVNPDAPLGHHIGQDVGHVTSTVLGASLDTDGTYVEGSVFDGTEPDPTKVDLPILPLNSGAFRLGRQLGKSWLIMGSAAYVQNPEPENPNIPFEWRYSLSAYNESMDSGGSGGSGFKKFYNTLIAGAVTNYDNAAQLVSFGEEFLISIGAKNFWGRLEVLQRTPAELLIANLTDQNSPRWISAITLGYTQKIIRGSVGDIGLGVSVTENFLPQDFMDAYGGDPWAGKLFMQFTGMKMMGM